MTRFVIVGIRRTGTTLIRTTLNNHPQIRCIGEAFNFGERFGLTRGHNCELGYRQYLASSPAGHVRDWLTRPAMVRAYLDQLYSLPGHEAIGFKMTQTQSRQFPMVMKYLLAHDTKFIHVLRRNLLKTLISRTVKKATGHSHTTKAVAKTTVSLRVDKLLAELERFDNENVQWERECVGQPYLKVVYEDFVADKDNQLARMLDFLGVERNLELSSHLVKGNPDNIREIIENYDEVAERLKGTKFEWCLTA